MFSSNMNRFSLVGVLTLALMVSCGDSHEQKAAEACARHFAYDYFNFKYVDALNYTTADTREVLSFLSSNMTHRVIDSLHLVTDTPAITLKHVELSGDTAATARFEVEHVIVMDTIGQYPRVADKVRSYSLALVRKGNEGWKVRMEAPLRSEE